MQIFKEAIFLSGTNIYQMRVDYRLKSKKESQPASK